MSKLKFRVLVIVSFLVLIAQIVVSGYEEEALPAQLRLYLFEYYEAEMTTFEWFMFYVDVVGIVSILLLLTFKPWSRHLYAVTLALVTVFTGITVHGEYTSALVEVQILMNGALIALMYFSDVRYHFTDANIENVT